MICKKCGNNIFQVAGASGVFELSYNSQNAIEMRCIFLDSAEYLKCTNCGLIYSVKNGKISIPDDILDLLCEQCDKSGIACIECAFRFRERKSARDRHELFR